MSKVVREESASKASWWGASHRFASLVDGFARATNDESLLTGYSSPGLGDRYLSRRRVNVIFVFDVYSVHCQEPFWGQIGGKRNPVRWSLKSVLQCTQEL